MASTREECLKNMSQPDSIMEPSIFNHMKRFLQAGGKLSDAVDVLANNYQATAEMINLTAEWLIKTGMEVHEVQQLVEDHLKQMIIKHFDPKKADKIFADDNEENQTPAWLTEIIGHPSWRGLIYKLAEMYPDCMMLQFTIKLISDAGFQGEITSISTASQQLDVFARILKTLTTYILSGCPDDHEDTEKVMTEFCRMVCHGEHTYLYSQAILYLLAKDCKGSANIKRLSQEVAKYAQEKRLDATPITMSLMGTAAYPKVYSALSSMLSRNYLNPADITILFKEYQLQDPPPVSLIRVPLFLDLILDSLFKPGSRINPEHRPKYIYLLAYAVSVVEQSKKGSRRAINKEHLTYTSSALDKVATICLEKKGSMELLSEVSTLYQYVKIPVVAMGILVWVKYTVSEPSYFKLTTDHTPIHLALLDEISIHHNTLHEKVLELLIQLMNIEPEDMEVLQQLQIKRVIIDRMVHLVSRNYVIPIIKHMRRCWQKQDMDVSLIRYFVTEMLEIIEPPYSQEFVHLLLPMIEASEITGNLKTENRDHYQLVESFIEYCRTNALQ
uniref:Negative elongation factor C/D n=1 Tax=Aceria tosichella TaxID=561515 RepID=A0A6G1SG95_9ACAR